MQAAQNTAQIFIGLNLKCNSCHDSFISKWKLKDAYGLASFFSEEDRLRLYRCEVAQEDYATPTFLFPELNRVPRSRSLADRRKTAAAIFLDPRNGRLPRTMVNRMWHRLLGRGLVENPDEMDGLPWNPELLDWLASDFVDGGYDLKRLLATIVASKAYQMRAAPRVGEPPRAYVFRGPEVRRLTAEQFGDAIGSITGDWNVYQPPAPTGRVAPRPSTGCGGGCSGPAAETQARRFHKARHPDGTRANGKRRPVRWRARLAGRFATRCSPRATQQRRCFKHSNWSTVNGWRSGCFVEPETCWVSCRVLPRPCSSRPSTRAGAELEHRHRREALRLHSMSMSSRATRLWLVVQDANSTAVDKAEAAWARAELVGRNGAVTPLTDLTPLDESVVRAALGPVVLDGETFTSGVRVKTPVTTCVRHLRWWVYQASRHGRTRNTARPCTRRERSSGAS